MALFLVAVAVTPAWAHTLYGTSSQHDDCIHRGAASHTTSVIDADTYPYSAYVICYGMQSKARWKVDGLWYSDTDTDTTYPYYASAGMTGGWDVFSSSDHNAKTNATAWWGFKLWH